MTNFWDDAEIIDRYSRADALTEGTLVEADPELLRDAGIRYPLAYTTAVFHDCIEWSGRDNRKNVYQDQQGREWDVLTRAADAMRRARHLPERTVPFTVLRIPRLSRATTPGPVTLYVNVGPGDDGAPVLTVMDDPAEL
ncbi:DUF6573 family protein [Amycolatopsis sp. H20-H5]|uniref:DUF6573 family protein n=1 Tax=Amycolatopsis sp. H20-H5 TaxID=3046309 RepID=UPI002DB7AA32|nr:DUF6573 family protein [Amycolatopsis sp. H20-H5]MEC3977178.1 DUF6573 family protein [Amycolatopsis sp. H20-H5]